MKKKIMIFMLLFAVLVGVGVPVQAKAEEDEYTFDEWCADNGFNCASSSSETNADDQFEYSDDSIYVYLNDGRLIRMFYKSYIKLFKWGSSTTFCVYNTYSDYRTLSILFYQYDTDGWVYCGYSASKYIHGGHDIPLEDYNVVLSDVVYTSVDIYEDYDFDTILIPKTQRVYSFENWCTDAGLSCSASSNESSSVIPFWYEPDSYNYIVRKTLTASSTSGVYQLTMLQRKSGAGHYPYYFEVNNLGYLGVAGAFSDTSAFTVRNFYYDADGNGWKLQDKIDVSDLPFDYTNVTFDENVVFIYSDTDIYADREATAIWQPASTEYYNVDIPEPEITRVPINPGSGSVGGQAEPGGLLSFVITLFTLVWTKLFAVEVSVDGYMISFQQIIIWGAIAAVLGFLVFSIFKKR